jgi:tRNA A37 methylthiotransferase MiaB
VKAERAERAAAVGRESREAFLRGCVSRTLEVLFETERDGVCRGHAENYAEVAVEETGLRGLVKNVQITAVKREMLVGVVV